MDADSAAYIGTLRRFGLERHEPELAKTLKQLALAAWILFGFSGYARVDFRVDSSGAPFIIDVNPCLIFHRMPKMSPQPQRLDSLTRSWSAASSRARSEFRKLAPMLRNC